MELTNIAEKALKVSKQKGAEEALASVSLVEAKEFNIESGRMTLLRTTFDQSVSIKSVLGNRQASARGNQFGEEDLLKTAQDSVQSAQAAAEIEGAGFAPTQGQKHFEQGLNECDDDWIYDQLQNVLTESKARFPKVLINGATVKFVKTHVEHLTTRGSHLSSRQNYYEGFVMFNSVDGAQTSSFNYAGFAIGADQNRKSPGLMKINHLEELLKQSQEQLSVQKPAHKFQGDIIVTPHCMQDFLSSFLGYIGSAQMMKKTSPFFGKKGEKVISDLLTLECLPLSDDFSTKSFWTGDGYLSENEMIFDKGVLKNYLLNHQAATQLKEKVSLSAGSHIRIRPGSDSLSQQIASTKEGVLLCRFSAGNPAENGDVSGVAKNSYYIKDGEIQFPIGETMLAMNLFDIFNNVQSVSRETLNSGYIDLPWVKMTGVTVS
jgi:PmbA protein